MKSNAFVCLNKVVDGSLLLNVRRTRRGDEKDGAEVIDSVA